MAGRPKRIVPSSKSTSKKNKGAKQTTTTNVNKKGKNNNKQSELFKLAYNLSQKKMMLQEVKRWKMK